MKILSALAVLSGIVPVSVFSIQCQFVPGASGSLVICSNSIHVGNEPQTQVRSTNTPFYALNTDCYLQDAQSLASANQSAVFSCVIATNVGNPIIQTPTNWPPQVDFSVAISLDAHGRAQDGSYTDVAGKLHTVAAGYAFDLHAEGKLAWNLMADPTNSSEWLGKPVKVFVGADYSFGASDSNSSYPGTNGIVDFKVNDGRIGPVHAYTVDRPSDFRIHWPLRLNPLDSKAVLLPLGEMLEVSYRYETHVKITILPEGFWAPVSYWTNNTDLFFCAKANPSQVMWCVNKIGYLAAMGVQGSGLLDWEVMQQHILEPVPLSSTPQEIIVVIPLEDFNLPGMSQTSDPRKLIRLSLLDSDYGRLVSEGDDKTLDGHDDTPRIVDGVYLQTWILPARSSMNASMTRAPIEIRVDSNGDFSLDQRFLDYVAIVRECEQTQLKIMSAGLEALAANSCQAETNSVTQRPEWTCPNQWEWFTVALTKCGTLVDDPKLVTIETLSALGLPWTPARDALVSAGTNGLIQVRVPVDRTQPMRIFRAALAP
jgi:hypothetical protein